MKLIKSHDHPFFKPQSLCSDEKNHLLLFSSKIDGEQCVPSESWNPSEIAETANDMLYSSCLSQQPSNCLVSCSKSNYPTQQKISIENDALKDGNSCTNENSSTEAGFSQNDQSINEEHLVPSEETNDYPQSEENEDTLVGNGLPSSNNHYQGNLDFSDHLLVHNKHFDERDDECTPIAPPLLTANIMKYKHSKRPLQKLSSLQIPYSSRAENFSFSFHKPLTHLSTNMLIKALNEGLKDSLPAKKLPLKLRLQSTSFKVDQLNETDEPCCKKRKTSDNYENNSAQQVPSEKELLELKIDDLAPLYENNSNDPLRTNDKFISMNSSSLFSAVSTNTTSTITTTSSMPLLEDEESSIPVPLWQQKMMCARALLGKTLCY